MDSWDSFFYWSKSDNRSDEPESELEFYYQYNLYFKQMCIDTVNLTRILRVIVLLFHLYCSLFLFSLIVFFPVSSSTNYYFIQWHPIRMNSLSSLVDKNFKKKEIIFQESFHFTFINRTKKLFFPLYLHIVYFASFMILNWKIIIHWCW